LVSILLGPRYAPYQVTEVPVWNLKLVAPELIYEMEGNTDDSAPFPDRVFQGRELYT